VDRGQVAKAKAALTAQRAELSIEHDEAWDALIRPDLPLGWSPRVTAAKKGSALAPGGWMLDQEATATGGRLIDMA
jgi:hypothetical protein